MAHGIEELESAELSGPPEDKKAEKESRLTSAAVLRSLYTKEFRADEKSAKARAQIQAMVDGKPPFDQAKLNATGQGSRANANFLMGQDLVAKANAGYQDIVTASKILMTISTEFGEPSERADNNAILQEELTRTIRKWGGFIPKTLRLIDLFDTHGVGVGLFPDTKDFRIDVSGLGEFLIPRQTEASEESILYAIGKKDTTVVELEQKIENEDAAAARGWNVEAVKAAMKRATDAVDTEDPEENQKQIKNNDVFASAKFQHVSLLRAWVREFDGSISYFIAEKDGEGDFLFEHKFKYPDDESAYSLFCYGVGNGTYHSIRGLGHMIFALVQLHNRLMCQKADGVMLDESVLLSSTSAEAQQRATLNYLGPFSLMDSGFDVVDRKVKGTSERTLPFLAEVKGLMGQVSSRFLDTKSEGAYQNETSTLASLESQGGSGPIDLFFVSWDRIIRQMCKRILSGKKDSSDPLVAEFHKRIEAAGITKEILDSVDHASTYAYRTIGSGSPAARSLSFQKLLKILPQLDEIGRKNLIYRFVEDLVGYQNAGEFASKSELPRQNSEATMAGLENILLLQGNKVPVLSYQMHGTHAEIHIPEFSQVLGAVETGEIDPMEALPGLQAALEHIGLHGEELGQDPSQGVLYGEVKEVLNNLNQIVTNMGRKIKAEQRQAQEAGGQEGPGAEERVAQMKIAMEEFKYQLAQRKGELELAIMKAKADQNLALSDFKTADQITKKLLNPRSDYSERR